MSELENILNKLLKGDLSIKEAVTEIKRAYVKETMRLTLDISRAFRRDVPEIIWGEGKSASELARAVRVTAERNGYAIATRVDFDKYRKAVRSLKGLKVEFFKEASILRAFSNSYTPIKRRGCVGIIAAGTSDIPVAEEARIVAETLGLETICAYDVGVAGLYRLLDSLSKMIGKAKVYIAVAGMEAALPSVLAGLLDRPVIAVPTSTGFGVGVGGLLALASSLQSCPMGVATVNIDGGAQAAVFAYMILK